ncbi:winged helix-turn-helix transcriptional regulator [Streptomyces fagopyri]|uniref:winged helix-turn-helix transcriptional regulator n=1 Tax=Streptomyces fagopyri TaxID=2662397 RepID=UPI0033E8BD2C
MEELGGHEVQACREVDNGMTRVFALLGKRWTGLVVAVLMQHPVHFAELRRAIPGISERMLSDRLSELVVAGLVVREVNDGPPLGAVSRISLREWGVGGRLIAWDVET